MTKDGLPSGHLPARRGQRPDEAAGWAAVLGGACAPMRLLLSRLHVTHSKGAPS
jgi:hypothetical protein